ncbi:CaiB/BaiF CoA-transferase family protein [Xanthobacter sp. V3C-3]|uniref:CaiB/BaiF CoA transferase family protein n=1 Tax=Xanthobacter lutulentifluminis TaxID=3119935 RepID=UPI003726B3C4
MHGRAGEADADIGEAPPADDSRGPLAGVVVLDLTRLLPGAFCTQLLADMGAEVIKVEQPGEGDYWRWIPPRVKTQSVQFLALNRGKKSITLDLKAPAGREALLRLAETADVLLEGFRPGVMARLGLSPEELHARNPRLVVCALTGFGQDGPLARLAAHDLNYTGMMGLLQLVNGSTTNLHSTGIPLADVGGGSLMALGGILAALIEARGTGKGRFVDVSVADGLLTWASFVTARWNAPELAGEDNPFDAPFNRPFYSVYEAADGLSVVVGAYEPKFWRNLCEGLGLPEWIDRQWVEGDAQEAQRAAIAAAFRTRPRHAWLELFARSEACVTPVLSAREAMASEHVTARGLVIEVDDPVEGRLRHVGSPLRFDGTDFTARAPAPQLGGDSDALLRSVGYSDTEIAGMRGAGVI